MTTHDRTTLAGYDAAIASAGVADRSDRLRLEFAGREPAQTLNGLLTNDIVALVPGRGAYAAALTPRGKVIADVRVFAFADRIMVDAPAAAAAGLLAMLRKYVNPRMATHRDVSGDTACLTVIGPAAAATVSRAVGMGDSVLNDLSPFSHVTGASGFPVVTRSPEFDLPAFDIMVPAKDRDAVLAALAVAEAVNVAPDALDTLRIEAGWPAWGRDMDDSTLAQEAGLDRVGAISFDKGCYTGQETVARVHFRGHVNRTLRGLRAEHPLRTGASLARVDAVADAVTDGTAQGSPVEAPAATVGDVRSAAMSPRFGHIALAYVRREIADGAQVLVIGPRDDLAAAMRARVVALPFG